MLAELEEFGLDDMDEDGEDDDVFDESGVEMRGGVGGRPGE